MLGTPTVFPTATPLPSGLLCARNNIIVKGDGTNNTGITQAQPPYPGDYHGQKIAYADALDKVYVIGCNTRLISEGAALPGGQMSFEQCVLTCSITQDCVGVYHKPAANGLASCLGSITPTNAPQQNPPNIAGSVTGTIQDTVRTARLLGTANKPTVIDTVYFLGSPISSNLGLCGGADNLNYNGSIITIQQRGGYFRGGNNADQYIACGGQSFSLRTNQGNTSLEWSSRITTSALPRSADACAKLCTWTQLENTNTAPNIKCESWEWLTDGETCNIYGGNSIRKATVNGKSQAVPQTPVGGGVVLAAGAYGSGINQDIYIVSYKHKRTLPPSVRGTGLLQRDDRIMVRETDSELLKADFIFPV